MKKQLLDKRDTDYVRDNLVFNYCLGNEQELLIESYVHNNQIDLRFDPAHFYFFMTGVHKKFQEPFTPDTFNNGVTKIYQSYALLQDILRRHGYDGRPFLIKEDNSKQTGLLFSPGAHPRVSVEALVQILHEEFVCQRTHRFQMNTEYLSTSFVGPYSGYEQIHTAFEDARKLNDLIFFGVHGVVITGEYREKTARPCDITAITGNVRRLIHLVCGGTCAQAIRQADYIIEELIAPSYSMLNFEALYTAVEDMMGMLENVYPALVRAEHRRMESFFTLAAYQSWLQDMLRHIFACLRDIPRYSPTILMALSYINRNFTRELSLIQLSEYVYANASTLSSEFNAEVGMSLSEYITGLRVHRAQELIETTNLSVPEIAKQAGFASAKYFREIFKKQTGQSPQQYRNCAQPERI